MMVNLSWAEYICFKAVGPTARSFQFAFDSNILSSLSLFFESCLHSGCFGWKVLYFLYVVSAPYAFIWVFYPYHCCLPVRRFHTRCIRVLWLHPLPLLPPVCVCGSCMQEGYNSGICHTSVKTSRKSLTCSPFISSNPCCFCFVELWIFFIFIFLRLL